MFFSSKKNEAAEPKEEAAPTKEEPKKEAAPEQKKDQKAAAGDKKTADPKKKAEETSSSSESDGEAENLSKADIEKIKKLIADQDKEIETLKETTKQYKEKLIYQLAENDNTIKRYKKEID